MANPEHVEIVKQGADAIKAWRTMNPEIRLDLIGADLKGEHLVRANLSRADLSDANLGHSYLVSVNLRGAKLRDANLFGAKMSNADLSGADLSGADLSCANLMAADISDANLSNSDMTLAILSDATLNGASLSEANLDRAEIDFTCFADVDLSEVKGLESVVHDGPSTIGIDTFYKSQGKIPEVFLRGCGMPEALITYLPSLIGAMEPIQFQSCFISYSSKDDEFARRLHGKMRDEKLRVWFAPEDMQGGKKSIEQIDRAIQVNDRLLLVLSKHSMNSEWVRREIKRARAAERIEKRTKLFPIALAPFTMIRNWRCDDADTGEDLAEKIREYHIPDFSNWKDHDAFEAAFADLLRDLRAEA